ncbi:MAG: glycosyltransferase [Candidatus Dadabacteria bacterium]|nr:glycosyltransferase [Candidatus Dadabacteria bacterium]
MTKQRKLKNMINAFAVIIQNYPDAILDIYGDGDDRKNLEEYVNKYKLSDHIKFKGLVSRPELLSSLYNYDIGFSYIPEGLHDPAPALKTLEYLACGLPVVATDTSGNRLSVKDGYNGVLSTDSPQDYASAFIRLVQSEWYMDAVSNSVKSVLEYDWEAIVRKNLLPIYEKMMSNE